MDLINQNKFKNWLIAILLLVNVMTVSIIFMQARNSGTAPEKRTEDKQSESVGLIKKELNLNDDQMKKFEQIRSEKIGEMKKLNDSLSVLKKQLAEELFSSKPDTGSASQKSRAIGQLQSRVELLRFSHFNELMAICTEEQKARLKPLLLEVFGKKPPKTESAEAPKPPEPARDRNEKISAGNEQDKDARPAPPDINEKLTKLSERLGLSPEQSVKVKKLFEDGEKKREKLRKIQNPDEDMIEKEKEAIRKAEDEGIKSLLNANQISEYEKMLKNRRK